MYSFNPFELLLLRKVNFIHDFHKSIGVYFVLVKFRFPLVKRRYLRTKGYENAIRGFRLTCVHII